VFVTSSDASLSDALERFDHSTMGAGASTLNAEDVVKTASMPTAYDLPLGDVDEVRACGFRLKL
jgi:hypothetical protein